MPILYTNVLDQMSEIEYISKACFMSSIVNSEDRMNVYLYMAFYAVVNWVHTVESRVLTHVTN